MKPLIIQYTNLLHRHGGPESSQVKEFRAMHSDDAVFLRRADTLDYVWRLKPAKT
jgi:hypothetical protein